MQKETTTTSTRASHGDQHAIERLLYLPTDFLTKLIQSTSNQQKGVYLAMLSFVKNTHGLCWCSAKAIADKTGYTPERIRRLRGQLAKKGFIRDTEKVRGKGYRIYGVEPFYSLNRRVDTEQTPAVKPEPVVQEQTPTKTEACYSETRKRVTPEHTTTCVTSGHGTTCVTPEHTEYPRVSVNINHLISAHETTYSREKRMDGSTAKALTEKAVQHVSDILVKHDNYEPETARIMASKAVQYNAENSWRDRGGRPIFKPIYASYILALSWIDPEPVKQQRVPDTSTPSLPPEEQAPADMVHQLVEQFKCG